MRGPSLRELSAVTVPEARSMLAFATRELKRRAGAAHDRTQVRRLREELARVEQLKVQFQGMSQMPGLRSWSNLTTASLKLGEALAELHARPTVLRCDEVVRDLADTATAIHHLRGQLQGGAK